MKYYTSLVFILCGVIHSVAEAKIVTIPQRPLSCNERMRHGPRGVAQGIAALAGCAVLYKARNELKRAAEEQCDSSLGSAKKYAYLGMAVSLCAGWIYYFASSAVQSLNIFFTDDLELRKINPQNSVTPEGVLKPS